MKDSGKTLDPKNSRLLTNSKYKPIINGKQYKAGSPLFLHLINDLAGTHFPSADKIKMSNILYLKFKTYRPSKGSSA